jgi:tetratricopeptide (TPR) repeat protein
MIFIEAPFILTIGAMRYPLAIILAASICCPALAQERVAGPPVPFHALHGGVQMMSSTGPTCSPCTDTEMKSFRGLADPPVAKRSARVKPRLQGRSPVASSNRAVRRPVAATATVRRAPVRIASGARKAPPKLVARAVRTNQPDWRDKFVENAMCRAKSAIQCNYWECAARRLREVLYIQPNHQEASQLLSEVYRAAGVDPTNSGHRQQLAMCLASNGRHEGALVEYRAATQLANTAANHIGLAKAALKMDQKSLALQEFQAAVRLDPFDQHSWEQIGFLQEARGNLQYAAGAFLEAARLNPRNPVVVEKALQIAQQLSSRFPQNPDRRLDLARAFLLTDQLPLAQQEYAQIAQTVSAAPHFDDWLALERENTALKQEGFAHRSLGQQVTSDSVYKFLNEGPQPNGGDDPADAAAKLKRSCNCD